MTIYRLTAFSLFLIFLIHSFLVAQDSLDVYQLDKDIVITANRIPTAFNDVARTVTVISNTEIQSIAAQSVPELLENVLGVDVKQRGMQGVQADISIRGAGFNQTLVLLDGIKLSDPQTGHHNMNLPVDLSDIERIEILKGPGSRLYGPNAFGGIINIITKKASKSNAVFGGLIGEYSLYESHLNMFYPFFESNHRFTIAKSASDGYRKNTDYQNFNFSYKSTINMNSLDINISSGYSDKKFGANNFYLPQFNNKDQYEKTRILYLQAGLDYIKESFGISPKLYFRKHNDEYFWKKNQTTPPSEHETHQVGLEVFGYRTTSFGTTTFGVEHSIEELSSNTLGTENQKKNSDSLYIHERDKSGVFIQQQVQLASFILSAGISAYHYSDQGWHRWPGADIAYRINNQSKTYISYSEGFRVPTYSNYYLKLPGATGSPDLKNERSQNYEIGYSYQGDLLNAEFALFNRVDRNLIDYVFNNSDSLYHAENFAKLTTLGAETGLKIKNPFTYINSIFLQYAYLDIDANLFGKNTLYILSHFKHQFMVGINYSIPEYNLSQSWKIRYEERLIATKQTTVDTRISWRNESLRFFIDVTNLLDEAYEDIPGVPMPGRWFKLGFEYNVRAE